MRSLVRLLAVLLAATLVLAPVTALAFTEAETEGEPTTTTSTFAPGMEPAVEAPPASANEPEDPWTGRYLAPLLLVGGVVVAAGYLFFYGARVRGRYEVVD